MEFSFSLVARSIRLTCHTCLGLINPDCPAFKEYLGKNWKRPNFQTQNEGLNWVWMCHGLARVPKSVYVPLRSLRSQTSRWWTFCPFVASSGALTRRLAATPPHGIFSAAREHSKVIGVVSRCVASSSRVPSRVARPTKSLRSTNEGPRHPRPRFVAHDG